jgi:hypothetical protein
MSEVGGDSPLVSPLLLMLVLLLLLLYMLWLCEEEA